MISSGLSGAEMRNYMRAVMLKYSNNNGENFRINELISIMKNF